MAKKVTGTVRTTISVPAEVKQRMDKVKEPVNWSALATAAFEAKLGEIAAQKEKKTMDDVIQRLRALKMSSNSQLRKDGHSAGEDFAKGHALPEELECIESLLHGNDWDAFFEYESAFSNSERLYFAIHPKGEHTRDAANEWWQWALTDEDEFSNCEEAEFLIGFVEGALDVWQEVKDQL